MTSILQQEDDMVYPDPYRGYRRQFVIYYYFVGWDCLSLGLHLCVSEPNIEVHLPFGFIRIGWVKVPPKGSIVLGFEEAMKRCFGLKEKL